MASYIKAEVGIIGGGPAGLCTGLELAQAGISVILCESQTFPIDKPCGEGLMPEGVLHLHRLGISEYLDPEHFSLFTGVSMINSHDIKACSFFEGSFGMGIRRKALSQAIYQRALKEPNLKILSSTRVLNIEQKSEYMLIKHDQGIIKTRLIIGADGLRSAVRKWANLDKKIRTRMRYGLRKHLAIKPWSSQVEVYFIPGLEAYITPCGPNQLNLTFLWHKKNFSSKISFENLIKCFPKIYEKTKYAFSLSKELATGPLEHSSRAVFAPGIALVGDASGYLDAITGEGNSIAMSQSQALAKTVVQALSETNKIISSEQLMPYANAHKAIVKNYYKNTNLLLNLAKYPMLLDNLIKFGAKYQRAFSYIINRSRTRA